MSTVDYLDRMVVIALFPFMRAELGVHGNIYYSVGYNCCGLAPSQLAGKIIAAMMAGGKSDLTDSVLIWRKAFYVSSAPLMYLSINTYKALFKLEDRRLGGLG